MAVTFSRSRPLPIPTTETAPYWRAALAGRLEIQQCRVCAQFQFYPRRFCTKCLSDQLSWNQATGRGRIYTYTVCRIAAHPAFESHVPYAVAIVELEEGVRMLGGIVDADLGRLRVDAPVRVCFERISEEVALPMFELAGESR